eukprot:1157450-Pelagomonas_calceolata.AAC.1
MHCWTRCISPGAAMKVSKAMTLKHTIKAIKTAPGLMHQVLPCFAKGVVRFPDMSSARKCACVCVRVRAHKCMLVCSYACWSSTVEDILTMT